MSGAGRGLHGLLWNERRLAQRGGGDMASRPVQDAGPFVRRVRDAGTVVRISDYRRREPPPPLLAYAIVSGATGTAVAAVVSLTVPGANRLAVWSAVVGSVCLLAGLLHDTPLLRASWAACHRLLRRHGRS